ncbi:MAG: hypothetical protein AAF725_02680 [Acidobacteriota bacterium]
MPARAESGGRAPERATAPVSSARRYGRFLAWSLALSLALAGAERFYSEQRAIRTEPGLGASWIWAPEAASSAAPAAFFAVRDVDLEAGVSAWMAVVADEHYTLWVNGSRVGSGGLTARREADFFEISGSVKPGLNRLMLEVASSRGAGGLMASLRVGEPGRAVLGTDASWRIFTRFDPSIFSALRPLSENEGAPPAVWQRTQTGRWRPAEALQRKPGILPVPGGAASAPVRVRYFSDDSTWRAVSQEAPLKRAGSLTVIDFGRPVEGHLEVSFSESPGASLLFFDLEDPDHDARRPPDTVMMPVEGSLEWRDPFARSFRYVTFVGTTAAETMRVEQISAEHAAIHRPPTPTARGVFGLEAPSPYRQAREAVWQRIREKNRAGPKPAETASRNAR